MKQCALEELVKQNFNVVFVNALQQFWQKTKGFRCFGDPKKQNLLLFLDGCRATYTDKTGRSFVANSGDVVYTPIGSEYEAKMSDFESAAAHTVGINFFLTDGAGEEIVLSDGIHIFRAGGNTSVPLLFHRTLRYDATQPHLRSRILLLEILGALAIPFEQSIPNYIASSVEYLAEHIEENPSIGELARRCSISEVYFRKQFQKAMGVSPVEYRNALRLNRARAYLEYGDISVQEISDMLGYATVSHFIKEFRGKYGISPLQYRKRGRLD